MAKPKNDGTLLSVRVSSKCHGQIARIQALLVEGPDGSKGGAEHGWRPGTATKGRIVETCIEHYFEHLEEHYKEYGQDISVK